MGVDAADLDGDGWQDLFVANVDQEMFSLYRNNEGQRLHRRRARRTAWPQATRLLSGWGLKFFDYDNDGHVDLLLANGHPDDMIALRAPDVKYKEPLLLFQHDGRRLRNISQQAGPVFAKTFPARGLAVGDFNNDGRRRRAHRLQRRGAGAAAQQRAAPDNHWVGSETAGRDVQSRRDRRADHLVGRRRAEDRD